MQIEGDAFAGYGLGAAAFTKEKSLFLFWYRYVD
jgi:hypothetical protein